MIYYLVRYTCFIAFQFFFRKVHLYQEKPLPKDKPIILAVNHPTGFLDPSLIGAFSGRVQNFMLRGDLFKKPIFAWFLRALHNIPIYRFRDGFSNLKNNQDTFDYCYQLLNENKVILILAEGVTKFERRLRPIQKGTARMAYGAFEKYGKEDIMIIPVGVNYTNSYEPRMDTYIEYGEPIHISDYREDYDKNPRRAVKLITDAISNQLKDRVIHIERDEDAPMTELLLEIYRNDQDVARFPIRENRRDVLRGEVALAKKVNAQALESLQAIKDTANEYKSTLEANKLTDISVVKKRSGMANWVFFILALIPTLVGYLVTWPFVFLGKKVTRDKVKRPEFRTSVMYGLSYFSYLIFWIIAFIISLIIGNVWGILFVVAMPFLGYLSQVYIELWTAYRRRQRFLSLSDKTQKRLLTKRADLKKWITADISKAV